MDIVGAQRRCALCHTITQRRCALCHTITHPCLPSPPQIDYLVYNLYDLTPEEIKIVEEG